MTRRAPAQGALFAERGRAVKRVRRAVDDQLTAQRRLGGLEPIDAGLIGVARTLADAIDDEASDPDGTRYTVGVLCGRLVPVLLELRGALRDSRQYDGIDDELVALVTALRDAPRPD